MNFHGLPHGDELKMARRVRSTLTLVLLGAVMFAFLSYARNTSAYGSDSPSRLTPHPTLDLPIPTAIDDPDEERSATPAQATLVASEPTRLTEGGCCPYPVWSHDSEWVLFFDRPTEQDEAALYGVPVAGGSISKIHDRVGVYAGTRSVVAYPAGGVTVIERWADGAKWQVENGARFVKFSPSARMVAWIVTSHGITFPDVRQRAIWVGTREQPAGREIVTVNGGSLLGWTGDENAIIVTGRLAPDSPAGIWKITIDDGSGRLLLEMENIHSPLLSPAGRWVAFMSTFNNDPDLDGLWVVSTDTMQSKQLPLFGSYRWRRDGVLLVIPMDFSQQGVSLWQVDVTTSALDRLTDPDSTPLPIANNDWEPSPDGKKMVFLSYQDRNLWVLHLPEP